MPDISRVILARLGRDPKRHAKERRAEFGYQFLARVALVAKSFALEVSVEAALVLRPVRQFVRLNGRVKPSSASAVSPKLALLLVRGKPSHAE